MTGMKSIIVVVLICFFTGTMVLNAQDINQMDDKGQRHGVWKKKFEDSDVLRYEGEFNHGKEVGTFKYYKNINGKAVLAATREFLPDGKAKVTFYSSKGKKISEGKMKGKLHTGEWIYYHKDKNAVMNRENYNEQGVLEGESIVYFTNGNIAEKRMFKNGNVDGKATWYSDQGVVTKIYHYKDGLLHGEAKFYDGSGKLVQEGRYKNDRKDGIWKYYENGELKEEKDFTRVSKNPYKKK